MAPAKMRMVHAKDPKDDILERLGDLDEFEIMFNQVLVAIYLRPDSMDLGGGKKIYLADQTRKEDEWQGKVGLVVKKGPMAFVDDDKTKFGEQNVERGDWVVFRTSDGWPISVNGQLCRLLEEVHIRARIPRPDFVF